MAKFTEETLSFWIKPLSKTEEERVTNTINMIKSAIKEISDFNELEYEVFAQGSYANNTNVRTNSDIDINVMLTSTVFTEFPDGKTKEDYGYSDGTLSYVQFKDLVHKALVNKFGTQNVSIGNKSIQISSSSYRVDADCVPTFQYRDYKNSRTNSYIEGVKFYSSNGDVVINYPKSHIKNGVDKNNATNYHYKGLVRIFKRIRNNMVEDSLIEKDIITSFLVECLVWNIPNSYIVNYSKWDDTVKNSISYLYNTIKDDEHTNWGEVSERLYLFRASRKWSKTTVLDFLQKMWDYMEYSNE